MLKEVLIKRKKWTVRSGREGSCPVWQWERREFFRDSSFTFGRLTWVLLHRWRIKEMWHPRFWLRWRRSIFSRRWCHQLCHFPSSMFSDRCAALCLFLFPNSRKWSLYYAKWRLHGSVFLTFILRNQKMITFHHSPDNVSDGQREAIGWVQRLNSLWSCWFCFKRRLGRLIEHFWFNFWFAFF